LPQWTIQKIKLQGRYAGFDIDDFIVFTKDEYSGKEAKLLAQIKRSITITEENEIFKEVIRAAWNDFNNPDIFNKQTDAFALINAVTDTNLRTILGWARHSEDENEFLLKVNKEKFRSKKKQNLLKAFRTQLQNVNGGAPVSDCQLWDFLKNTSIKLVTISIRTQVVSIHLYYRSFPKILTLILYQFGKRSLGKYSHSIQMQGRSLTKQFREKYSILLIRRKILTLPMILKNWSCKNIG